MNKPVPARGERFRSGAVQAGSLIVTLTLETTRRAARKRGPKEAVMANRMMNKIGRVAAGLAAVSLVAAATTASADPRYYYGHRGHGDTAAAAVAAGIVGLAVGAAIADSGHHDRYYERVYAPPPPPPPPPRYYGYGYYGYGYAPRPYYDRDCWTTREYDRWNGSYYERTVCR
jgi:hypothetical protein